MVASYGAGTNDFSINKSPATVAAARLGGFEGMTAGIGPAISYSYSVGGLDLAAEAKWLPEVGVTNRLSGNTVWFKLVVSFGANKENPLDAL